MRLPILKGIIKRRILVNFRVEPAVIQCILPPQFRPKLHNGKAIAGICLIRLENIRPKFAPEIFGLTSENAAHRIAVLWDENGVTREGVFISRRDTNSFINSAVGGTLFPGEHHRAAFKVEEVTDKINLAMRSDDKTVAVELKGKTAHCLPKNSIFNSLEEASKFFETGSLGYSVTKNGNYLDGITLETKEWRVDALDVKVIRSSFYEDAAVFPGDKPEFDHALIMTNIEHEWHSAPNFQLKQLSQCGFCG